MGLELTTLKSRLCALPSDPARHSPGGTFSSGVENKHEALISKALHLHDGQATGREEPLSPTPFHSLYRNHSGADRTGYKQGGNLDRIWGKNLRETVSLR